MSCYNANIFKLFDSFTYMYIYLFVYVCVCIIFILPFPLITFLFLLFPPQKRGLFVPFVFLCVYVIIEFN